MISNSCVSIYDHEGGGQDRFTIEKTSGEIKTTAQPTDLETQSSYSFQVTATDVDGRTVGRKLKLSEILSKHAVNMLSCKRCYFI